MSTIEAFLPSASSIASSISCINRSGDDRLVSALTARRVGECRPSGERTAGECCVVDARCGDPGTARFGWRDDVGESGVSSRGRLPRTLPVLVSPTPRSSDESCISASPPPSSCGTGLRRCEGDGRGPWRMELERGDRGESEGEGEPKTSPAWGSLLGEARRIAVRAVPSQSPTQPRQVTHTTACSDRSASAPDRPPALVRQVLASSSCRRSWTA